MGFIVTAPTPIPVDLDGSQDQETWGESGGPFGIPPEEGGGLAAQVFASNTINYIAQKSGRWSRATSDRMARSDEGLLSSCVLSQGVWNTGAATLDVTLTPSRVVIDYDNDGGIVLEIKAPAGSPETLTALRDTYLSLSEAGAYALTAVPNGDPAPAPPANHVHIWVLVTDATELTAANLANGIASYPCLATVGARNLTAETFTAVGPTTIGDEASDTLAVVASATFAENLKCDGGLTISAGQTLTANGDCILGDAAGDAIIVPGTMTIQQNASFTKSAILGNNSPPTVIGEHTRDATGAALYYSGAHVIALGLHASGRQEANTGSAQITTTMQTTRRQHAPVTLHVTVEVYISRSAAGTVTMKIEEDNGVDGGGQLWSTLGNAFVTPTISSAFTLVKFTRVRTADSTPRYYRLSADAGAGFQQDMKEGLLELRPAD